jgi:hypothetical protein
LLEREHKLFKQKQLINRKREITSSVVVTFVLIGIFLLILAFVIVGELSNLSVYNDLKEILKGIVDASGADKLSQAGNGVSSTFLNALS